MKELCAFLDSTINNRSRRVFSPAGYANGYVAVPPEHPMYGKDYNDMNYLISIHGGLTFSDTVVWRKLDNPNIEILTEGFDELPEGWWVFGFDTMHYNDSLQTCNKEYCISETLELKRQLEELWKKTSKNINNMTSADILVKISNLKDEVESKQKEIESLEEELREIGKREAARIVRKQKERAERMAKFIKHNSSRTIVVEMTKPAFNEEAEYLGEEPVLFTIKPGDYKLVKSDNGWYIEQPGVFAGSLEFIDNIHILFE